MTRFWHTPQRLDISGCYYPRPSIHTQCRDKHPEKREERQKSWRRKHVGPSRGQHNLVTALENRRDCHKPRSSRWPRSRKVVSHPLQELLDEIQFCHSFDFWPFKIHMEFLNFRNVRYVLCVCVIYVCVVCVACMHVCLCLFSCIEVHVCVYRITSSPVRDWCFSVGHFLLYPLRQVVTLANLASLASQLSQEILVSAFWALWLQWKLNAHSSFTSSVGKPQLWPSCLGSQCLSTKIAPQPLC